MSIFDKLFSPGGWTDRDARGTPRRLLSPFAIWWTERRADFSPSERKRLRRESSRWRVTPAVLITLLQLAVLPPFYMTAIRDATKGAWTPAISLACIFTLQLILWAVYAARSGWRSPMSFRVAMLELRRCPSCGYRLTESAVEADGCAVCPECGAAWRIT